MKKYLSHPNLAVRFFSLYGLAILVFLAVWLLSYYFLPDGFLRGRMPSQALAGGDTAASSFWLEFARILGLNLAIGAVAVALPSLLKDEHGYPFGYFTPLIWGGVYAVCLGTNSFSFPLPGGKMFPSLEVLTRSGPYELAAFMLIAVSLNTIARYQLEGQWPRQTLLSAQPKAPDRWQWSGVALAVIILAAANAWEAYRVITY